MYERFFRNRYEYSRWDYTQHIGDLDAEDILKSLSDDYMESGSLQQALRELMQNGIRGDNGQRTMGLREMMERMRNMRNQQLNRYNMASGVMDDLREKLEEIKQLEREGIQRRLDGGPESASQQPSDSQQPPSGQQQQAGDQSQEGAQADQRGQRGQQGQSRTDSQQGQQGQQDQGQQGQSGEGGEDLTPEQGRGQR